MSENVYNRENGLGHTPSYVSSPKPWCSSSVCAPAQSAEPYKASFEYVTNYISCFNPSTQTVRLGWSRDGVKAVTAKNFVPCYPSQAVSLWCKCTELYIISDTNTEASLDLFVGLTSIAEENLPWNWTGSAGI